MTGRNCSQERGGISAPQNLHRTRSRFLLAGTTWSLLHAGQVRLRPKMVPTAVNRRNGFIGVPPFEDEKSMIDAFMMPGGDSHQPIGTRAD